MSTIQPGEWAMWRHREAGAIWDVREGGAEGAGWGSKGMRARKIVPYGHPTSGLGACAPLRRSLDSEHGRSGLVTVITAQR